MSLYNLYYIKKESLNDEISKYQLVLYDFNNEIFETERIHKYLADLGYENEKINKFNLQNYASYSIPTHKDLIQCKQLIMFYIFRAKIYNDQMFYNDLCYQYFGEGYITNFSVEDTKAGCCVLSNRAYHKRDKMILCQMMNIYDESKKLYDRFTYFYLTEFRNNIQIFNNWFFSKFPQFSINYNTNINSDESNEYISFIFLDLLKLYEHYIIQEKKHH